MSFFYLCPVSGDLPFHILKDIVFKRIEFLTSLVKSETLKYNEYVIDGSVYDNVGHFMLCIILILCDNRQYSQYYIRAEIELFKRRLFALTSRDMRTFAKKALRNLDKYETVPELYEPLRIVCQHLQLKHKAKHICISTHEKHCTSYSIKLSFKHCLQLIAIRDIELKNGIASLPCGKWLQYLSLLYNKSLLRRIQTVNVESLKTDPRIMELVLRVKNEIFRTPKHTPSFSKINSSNVDAVSKLFPPCMLNLHQQLRKRHRLSHEQRFYYSLFLKDIGMPVEEAVEFWRNEYRQTPSGNHSCSHNWLKDEKKYLYGIRHMYGLEGARKNYLSVSCKRIQGTCNAGTEGGCPFKTFDANKMVGLLNIDKKVIQDLFTLKQKSQYTSACLLYLKHKIAPQTLQTCDSLSFTFTPVYYYSLTDTDKLLIQK